MGGSCQWRFESHFVWETMAFLSFSIRLLERGAVYMIDEVDCTKRLETDV